MSYESSAEPIKLGYLFDFRLPEGFPQERRDDLVQPFELVFDEGVQRGMIDRPVEIVFREVEGLPKGSAKAVIDGYGELVDEGCLAVFGVDDPELGEAVVAAVVVVPDAVVTAEELQGAVAEQLAGYKRIRHVVMVDEIPRLPSGKALRRTLKEEWLASHQ